MPKSDFDVFQLREIERMEEYQTPRPYPSSPAVGYLINSLLVMLFLAMAVMLAIKVYAEGTAQDQPICKAVNATSYPDNARVAQWVGYPEKWAGMPEHFNDDTPIFLYLDDTIAAGYVLHFDADRQELWIFPHWSFVSRGLSGGTHDLCDVLVYKLGS